MEVNKGKYHQTERSSELLTEKFINLFGHHGEEEQIETVLDGTFDLPESNSEATKEFLKACIRPDNIQDIEDAMDPVGRFHKFIKGFLYSLI